MSFLFASPAMSGSQHAPQAIGFATARRITVLCLTLLTLVPLTAPASAQGTPSSGGAAHRADPLLSVDLNRSEIVDRIMTQWQAEITTNQRESVKQKLAGLRADRLLAASLVGSFDGVLHVLYGQEQADQAAVNRAAPSVLGASGHDGQKTLGDANIDLVYVPITPCRLIDTRSGQSSALGQLGGVFTPNERRPVAPAGACGIPLTGVKNLVLSATTFNYTPNSGGYLAILPPGGVVTTVVDVFNYGAQWSSGSALVSTGSAGQMDVVVALATADVILDVVGYFRGAILPAFGSVTSVGTGAGLAGGPISSTGTINLTANQLLPTTACAPNQIAKWSGSAWACAADNAGGTGTVTSVATGAGLNGGPITGTGTINLTANQLLPTTACASGQIAKWNGSAWTCAADDAGPANAFVQGGNAFGVPAVLGTTDGQPLTVGIGGGDGLRITRETDPTFGTSVNVVNGVAGNTASKTCLAGAAGLACRLSAATVVGATVAGGDSNVVSDTFGVVAGGFGNRAGNGNGDPNDAIGATVGGGFSNASMRAYATVGGGSNNAARGAFATVGGGNTNTASSAYATLGGGFTNVASDEAATVGGGYTNTASGTAATVGGGLSSTASAGYATVGGGNGNTASAAYATVGGGVGNWANGFAATVPGGQNNSAAGVRSFAAGYGATAGDRTFVWNSYDTGNNLPNRTDSFRVQAANGFDVNYGANKEHYVAMNADVPGFIITTSVGATLTVGGIWTDNSDRAKKRDFSPISTQNARDILRKVVALPLSTWSYIAEDVKIRHIGPMAQDFWKAFGFGYDDKSMNGVDARGVTLAAIQGLNQKLTDEVKAKRVEIAQLKSRLAAIERRLGLK